MSGELHDLANGLPSPPTRCPARETVALGLYAQVGSRSEPEHLDGLAHLSSIWCSRAPAAATRASSPRRSRMSAATSTPGPPRPDASTAGVAGRAICRCVAELIADLVRAPHFDESTSSARRRSILSGARRSRRFARRPRPRPSVRGGVRRPAARPLGARPRGDASARSARRLPATGSSGEFVPSRLILVGERQGRRTTQLVELAERLFGDMEAGPSPPIEPARLHRRRAQRPPRASSRRIGASACPGLRGGRPDDYAALAFFVQASRRRHSSRLFQELREERGPRLFGRRLARRISPTPGLFCDLAAPRTARDAGRNRSRDRTRACSPRPSRRSSEREVERARAQIEAGMLMSLESRWGQRRAYGAARSRCSAGRAAGRAARRSCDAVDARRGARGRRARCSTGRARDRVGRRAARAGGVSDLDDARRRALGRLGPDRLRQRPEARALRPGHRRPARAAGDVGAGARRLGPRRDLRSRLGRGRRRALGPAPAGAAAVGAVARRGPLPRLADAVPPPRLLPRHGAAMGLDARARG